MEFFHRILLFLMPAKYQPDSMYLRKVPLSRVHLFTLIQLVFFILLWIIKTVKVTSILFPLMLVVMILVRKMLNLVFTQRELKILDDIMPESTKRQREDSRRRSSVMIVEELSGGKDRKKSVVVGNALEIPLASGNVMRIPLNTLNVTDEVNKSGIWKKVHSDNSLDDHDTHEPLLEKGKDKPIITRKRGSVSISSGGERRFSLLRTTDDDGGITFKFEQAP
jgi:sodium bicarbonate transporter 10